ncbi:MAG: hypothetical protein P1U57_02285 [Oleibacter sp.]|nr:hypothetical protein [Thalassolituus sp.]
MRILIFIYLAIISLYSLADFVHPMDFNGSESQKNEVIDYINKQVRQDYCESDLDMCQESMLRMMEQENLNAFKKATSATDRRIMDRAITDYCESGVDMCNYSTIFMMYEENVKASNKKLQW